MRPLRLQRVDAIPWEVAAVSSIPDTLEEIAFGTVGGEEISLADALRFLKLDFTPAVRRPQEWAGVVVERIVLEQAAVELGLEPSDEEIQVLMRDFRQERSLYSAVETERFLAGHACSLDDFAEAMEMLWTERALRHRYAEEPAERHFRQHSADYDSAVLSELVVADEGVARELALQLREEGADFAGLVRRHSTADSRLHAGFIGETRRGALRAREAAAIFAAEPDEVIGPFPHGREFRLLRVHEARRAVFTEAIRGEIVEQLWREWLGKRVRAAQPVITILGRL
jgi:parvulin-like peptidyl-prolyl isomerase